MKTIHIIYNPLSANSKGKEKSEVLKEKFVGSELEFCDVTKIKSYKYFFENIGEDDVLITGGDGTLNRFINNTRDIKINNKIYYYPTGSGNDFWNDLGFKPGDDPVCINKYLCNLPDVTVNGKTVKFLNNVGFGIDGYCCEVGDKLREKLTENINYASIAIKGLLFHFKPVKAVVTVDGSEHTYKNVWLAPTMNGRFYGGGMMPTPAQDRLNAEGKLSVMIMHRKSKLLTLAIFPSIFSGEHIKHKSAVEVLCGNNITVKFNRPTALQIDGETVLGVTQYSASRNI